MLLTTMFSLLSETESVAAAPTATGGLLRTGTTTPSLPLLPPPPQMYGPMSEGERGWYG